MSYPYRRLGHTEVEGAQASKVRKKPKTRFSTETECHDSVGLGDGSMEGSFTSSFSRSWVDVNSSKHGLGAGWAPEFPEVCWLWMKAPSEPPDVRACEEKQALLFRLRNRVLHTLSWGGGPEFLIGD